MGIVGLDGDGMVVRGITGGLCVMNTVWEFYLVYSVGVLFCLLLGSSPAFKSLCFSCSWFSSQG